MRALPQDPGVMAASLNLFYDMSLEDPSKFKDLAPSFVSILKQIIEHRLPREFDYHKVPIFRFVLLCEDLIGCIKVPAPWVQIKILKILAILGADDHAVSEGMYEVLRDCLRRADVQSTAAYGELICYTVFSLPLSICLSLF